MTVVVRDDGALSLDGASTLGAELVEAFAEAPEARFSSSSVEPTTGMVTIALASDLTATDVERITGLESSQFELVRVDSSATETPASTPLGGSKTGGCSVSFAVEWSSGTRGFVTAGHCIDSASQSTFRNWPGDMTRTATHEAWIYDSRGDLGLIRLTTGGGIISDNFTYQVSGASYSNRDPALAGVPSNGQYICRWGHTTGRECDTVADNAFTSTTVGNQVRMDNLESDYGDSGGPWWDWVSGVGTVQYGVHFGWVNAGTAAESDMFTRIVVMDDYLPAVLYYD